MRRSVILAAAVAAMASAQAFAGFTFTFVPGASPVGTYTQVANGTGGSAQPATGTPLFAVDIYALNTGGADTGTGISAIQINGTSSAANPFIFRTSSNGTPNGNNYNGSTGLRYSQDQSYLSLLNTAGSDPTFLDEQYSQVSATPASFGNNGTGPQRVGVVTAFEISAKTPSGTVQADATLNGGKGLLIGHIVLPAGTATLEAAAAGSTGAKIFKNQQVVVPNVVSTGTAPVVTPAAAVVTFGQTVTNGKTFSVNVSVADVDGGLLTLAAGAASGGSVTGLTITPAGGANSPAVFTVAGTVAYGPFNTLVTIPLTATDSTGLTGSAPLVLTLVPEPTTLAALGAAGLGLIRRRK